MKVYKTNNNAFNFFLVIVTLCVLFSVLLGFKLPIGVFVVCGLMIVYFLIYNLEERISKITLNLDSKEIIFERTSMFNLNKKENVVSIDKINCFFYKKRGPRAAVTTYLKFEIEENTPILISSGWDLEDLERIERDLNRIKNN